MKGFFQRGNWGGSVGGWGMATEYNFNPFSLLQFKNLSETLGRY
jgi:hypothetical protein